MSGITFTPEQKARLVEEIKAYFATELDREIGGFQAEFLLDFFTGKVGPYYYNQGLLDARVVFESRVESVGEAIHELEQPTPFAR